MKKFSAIDVDTLFQTYPYSIYSQDYITIITDQFREWSGDGDYFAFDNLFNPDGTLPDMKLHPAPSVPKYMTGANGNIHYQPSLSRTHAGVYNFYNNYVATGITRVFRFRNHVKTVAESGSGRPGFPFGGQYYRWDTPHGFRYYEGDQEAVFPSDHVPLTPPSPLPTWTFANNNGYIFLICLASSDPDNNDTVGGFYNVENDSPESHTFYGSSWLGYRPSFGPAYPALIERFAWVAITVQILGPFSAGTTRGIDPTFYNYTGTFPGPGTPHPNMYKVVVAFGVESAPGQHLSWASDVYHNPTVEAFTTNMLCTNPPGTTFPALTGDGILTVSMNSASCLYETQSVIFP